MSLEQTAELYASVLRQLLPDGVYDTAEMTHVADDIYAHAKALAQADIDAHRLLRVLETIPVDLLADYEREYGLPMQCMVPGSQTIEERISVLRWIRQHRNVMNREYLEQILAIFGVVLLELKKHKPMQCTGTCVDPVNTEELRYKVRLVIPSDAPADLECIIDNYLPGYLQVDILRTPLLFKTSKPYPLEHIETLRNDVVLSGSTLKEVYQTQNLNENIHTSLSLMNSVLTTQSSGKAETSLLPESVITALDMKNSVLNNVLLAVTLVAEGLDMQLKIDSASLNTILISSSPQHDSITTECHLDQAILG